MAELLALLGIVIIIIAIAVGVFVAGRVNFIVREKGYAGDEYKWVWTILFSPYGGALLNALPNKRYQEQLLQAIRESGRGGQLGSPGNSALSDELPKL